jgi:transposase
MGAGGMHSHALGRAAGPSDRRTLLYVQRSGDSGSPRDDGSLNRNIKRECDFALYCERNLIERFFNLLKHFRAIATRYDKLARNFLAGVQLAAVTILLN